MAIIHLLREYYSCEERISPLPYINPYMFQLITMANPKNAFFKYLSIRIEKMNTVCYAMKILGESWTDSFVVTCHHCADNIQFFETH